MILFILACIGIAATVADVDDYRDKKTKTLRVSEGGNLTIPIHIKKSDEDPQVLVTFTKGSSREMIAQLFCQGGECEREYKPGVSLIYNGNDVTLILRDMSYNQTGLYEVSKLSGHSQTENIYNVTVFRTETTLSPGPLLKPWSKSFTAGLTTAAVGIPVLIAGAIAIAIGIFYWRRTQKKNIAEQEATFFRVPQDDNTPASSCFGSQSVINID
ncbi:uncharacterized protein si:rp71-80o10.4 [Pseudorasbora parva]|uniref:uncharacterized protein si:rp71-80o10.4 n=1 Tax=Pseudorasbora parva TaxID=51549 RepID=UPI00351E55C7